MAKFLTIYLIRHARQSSALCNVNVPLAKEGRQQAELLGQRLKHMEIEKVYSSDLIRAVETADIVRGYTDLSGDIGNEFYQYAGLQETNFGDLTGLEDELLRVKFKDFYELREKSVEDVRIPGGENGEEVYTRMKESMAEVIEDAKKNDFRKIAVISHGGAIRCYLAGILQMPQGMRYYISKNMENTAITELRYFYDKDRISVERLNDYAHLEGHEKLLRKYFISARDYLDSSDKK